MKSKTTLSNYFGSLSQNTSALNLALGDQMNNDSHRYLLQKYFFNERSFGTVTVGDQQKYPLPYNYSKLKTSTITIGNLKWTPTEIFTRREWDELNVFPYYADIPANYFIYDGNIEFWPIPSTGSTQLTFTGLSGSLGPVNGQPQTIAVGSATGKILAFTGTTMQVAVKSQVPFGTGAFTTSGGATGTVTATSVTQGNQIGFNYQIRVPDFTLPDYVTGTVSVNSDPNTSLTVTGSGTSWLTAFSPTAGSVKNLNLWIQFTSPLGDGNWYQIDTIDSATSLTLLQPYQGADAAGVTYTIGQMPLLLEDFHDIIAYRSLLIYYSSISLDVAKKAEFKALYDEGIAMMDRYVGTKSLDVNLGRHYQVRNPNIYQQNFG